MKWKLCLNGDISFWNVFEQHHSLIWVADRLGKTHICIQYIANSILWFSSERNSIFLIGTYHVKFSYLLNDQYFLINTYKCVACIKYLWMHCVLIYYICTCEYMLAKARDQSSRSDTVYWWYWCAAVRACFNRRVRPINYQR